MSLDSNLRDGSHTNDASETRRSALGATLFASLAVLAGFDLFVDFREGASVQHWVVEGALLTLSVIGLALMIRSLLRRTDRLEHETDSLSEQLRAEAADSIALRQDLQKATTEAEQWRTEARELVQGLSRAIDRQLEKWGLSDAEKEVALLLLKGLSHKEIADIRDTSDATTRQQARAVYKKAGLSGRNELSAFFLEDLLMPIEQETNSDPPKD